MSAVAVSSGGPPDPNLIWVLWWLLMISFVTEFIQVPFSFVLIGILLWTLLLAWVFGER